MYNDKNPRIYVGGMAWSNIDKELFRKTFEKIGKVRNIDHGPSHAWVEYYDYHDSRKAVKKFHNEWVFNDFESLVV